MTSESQPARAASLYVQLRNDLREKILDGVYLPGSQLPSENELVRQLDVSRITVRQALGELQREGLIYKVHGKGSFVSRPKATQDVTQLQGLAEALAGQGIEVINRLLDFRFGPAPATVAQRLLLGSGATVGEIHRVRLLNREPVSLEITWLASALARRLERCDLIGRDLFDIIENDCSLPLGRADIAIDALPADRRIASVLGVPEGAPVMHVERLTHDLHGRPVDYEHLYYRGDAFQYRLHMERRPKRQQERKQ